MAIQRLALGRAAKSQMLTGLRGVGKTVLLQEFGRVARGRGWIHEHLEATEDMDFIEAIAQLVRRSLLRQAAGLRVSERARRALGVLRAFRLRWHLPDVGELETGFDPVPGSADSGLLDVDLAALFLELGEVSGEHDSGVLFTIDEVQYLTKDSLAALIVALHRVSQNQVPLMVAGGGLPSLPGLAGEAKSYAERLFDFRLIGSLSADDSALALRKPAADEGVAWEQAALERTHALTEGYPYFLQEFGKEIWDGAPGPVTITAQDVDDAVPVALASLDDGFFRVRVDRTTDAERAYLRAMASLGPGPYGSGDVASSLGRTTTQLGPTRDSLIKRGLCYSPRWGQLAFTVPMFDQYVRRALV